MCDIDYGNNVEEDFSKVSSCDLILFGVIIFLILIIGETFKI